MKKTVFKILFVAAFTMVAGYSVYSSQQNAEMSDLTMANIEALARGESGGLPWNGMYTDWSRCCCESGRPTDQCGASFMPCHN